MPQNIPPKKYLLLVGDGMADYPLPELNGKTPLEVSRTPNMDRIAGGCIGRTRTIPDGMGAGSDVANLSLLGYDPSRYITGRSPLEAAAMGVQLGDADVAFRMNLVTLDHRSGGEIRMVSHSSGDITTPEGRELVAALDRGLSDEHLRIHGGVAYRHLLVWTDGPVDAETIPPHDVLDQDMAGYLSTDGSDPVVRLMRRSWPILRDHPVNTARRSAGLPTADSIWLWGQGKAPRIPRFQERYGLKGAVISAVDLMKGIGVYLGFRIIEVEGATGYLNTNYRGKAEAALEALGDRDFVFVHVEAPDEAGHNGNVSEKIQAIESFDEQVVGTILNGVTGLPDYRVMVASDHYTPIPLKTHSREPTPFAWADRRDLDSPRSDARFTENRAEASGVLFDPGWKLMAAFLGRTGSGA